MKLPLFSLFVIAGLDPAIYPSGFTFALMEAAMNGIQNGWAWKEINFSDWKHQVDERLVADYGITIEDSGVDDDYLKPHWEMKQSPYEFVEWYGIKYDLDPASAHHWG